jgi:hypothetical protein
MGHRIEKRLLHLQTILRAKVARERIETILYHVGGYSSEFVFQDNKRNRFKV